jgi:hypothetical protein
MKKAFFFVMSLPAFLSVQAQVPVSKEPMHHDVLDNAHVRLLDVHIPPGDTSQFHIHATPSVFLILSDAKTGSQVLQEEDHSKSPIPDYGNMWFEGFYKLARIHRVWNSDTLTFHVMDIELPNKNYIAIDSPIRQEAFTFLFEEKPVRAYRLSLAAGTKISISKRKADILLIELSDSVDAMLVNEKSFHQKGDYMYIPSGNPIEFKYNGAGKSAFAFFELK